MGCTWSLVTGQMLLDPSAFPRGQAVTLLEALQPPWSLSGHPSLGWEGYPSRKAMVASLWLRAAPSAPLGGHPARAHLPHWALFPYFPFL